MQKSKEIVLIDLTVALVIMLLFAALAIPAYAAFTTRTEVAAATGDVGELGVAIEQFRFHNGDQVPRNLEEIGIPVALDPRGQAHEYVSISAAKADQVTRRDAARNRLNTDFDRYSRGSDRESIAEVSAQQSRDDIVRANDGVFIGLGMDY